VKKESGYRIRMITNPLYPAFNRLMEDVTYLTFLDDFATWNVVKWVCTVVTLPNILAQM
jgi:hypothetical protein